MEAKRIAKKGTGCVAYCIRTTVVLFLVSRGNNYCTRLFPLPTPAFPSAGANACRKTGAGARRKFWKKSLRSGIEYTAICNVGYLYLTIFGHKRPYLVNSTINLAVYHQPPSTVVCQFSSCCS